MRWRWQEDNAPGTPWDNMALDDSLFAELQRDPSALPIVRVYYWDRPAVSIGRLQDELAVLEAFPDLPSVRRSTGGRAVVHGADVTISVTVRDGDLPLTGGRGVMSSYRQIVSGVVEGLCRVGVAASLGETVAQGSIRASGVHCFAQSARCDVVEEGTGLKLAGCAQRRQGGVILQQMSIPLVGIPDTGTFVSAVKHGIERSLGVSDWISVDRVLSV